MNTDIRVVNMLIQYCRNNNIGYKIEISEGASQEQNITMFAGKHIFYHYSDDFSSEFLVNGSIYLYARLLAEELVIQK